MRRAQERKNNTERRKSKIQFKKCPRTTRHECWSWRALLRTSLMISDAHVLTVKFHNTGDKEESVQTPGVEAEVLQRIKKNQKWHRVSEQHHCKLENNESSMSWVELFPTWNDLQSQTMWEAGKGMYRHATSQKFYLPPKEEKKSRKRKTEMPRYRRSNTKVSLRKFLMITKVGRTCRPSWING